MPYVGSSRPYRISTFSSTIAVTLLWLLQAETGTCFQERVQPAGRSSGRKLAENICRMETTSTLPKEPNQICECKVSKASRSFVPVRRGNFYRSQSRRKQKLKVFRVALCCSCEAKSTRHQRRLALTLMVLFLRGNN